ncbi:ABC transporter ATP-binding protein [Rubellimicrobium arenae]|uniref:ABC transporter ATP-binding protein n=1 Tax=Rubellimicrobium arenae TaxID=2817372 RepID=UPI001B306816|nr:sn-glycerol-3-phosphate ABC transporter ATP-binding protein UgpC [Rubellimicrobium arenae]
MAEVTLHGVSKAYGGTQVIHDVSLEVAQGEFVVFVGPSGCGKSTLLRMIAGLEEVTGGDVLIGGQRVNDTAARDRGVAMVFQNYALYPHMSVRDNMAFGLRNMGTARADIDRRIAKAAGILQLEPYLDRKPRAMSGGQRQRVAIGRAIVREPEVFLFDEPLSNLDAALRVQMRTEIAKLHHALGATMIYVTHDQTEAMTMADRIVVLRAGRIEQVGAPLELYERPANLFVAGFLGSPKMNFLRGRVAVAQGSDIGIDLAGGVRLPARVRPGSVRQGDEVTLGLRPENLGVAPDGELRGHVDVVEQLGSVQLVYATVPDGTTVVAELRDRRAPAVGSEVPLVIGPGIRHVFDADGAAVTLPEGDLP